MIVSTPPLRPWYAVRSPWTWFRGKQRDLIGSGTPQQALTPASARLGFNPACYGASNSSGLSGSTLYPATVGAVLNMSAAQIASAPAFAPSNRQ